MRAFPAVGLIFFIDLSKAEEELLLSRLRSELYFSIIIMDSKITSFDKTFLSFLLRQLIAYDKDRMRITVTKLG